MEELKNQLKQGTFYYHKFGLLVKGKVNFVLEADDNVLEVSFNGGSVTVYLDKIQKVYAPGHVIRVFKWCYLLKNNYGEEIGYIGYMGKVVS